MTEVDIEQIITGCLECDRLTQAMGEIRLCPKHELQSLRWDEKRAHKHRVIREIAMRKIELNITEYEQGD